MLDAPNLLILAIFAVAAMAVLALLISIRYEVKLANLTAEADGRRTLIDNLAEGVYRSSLDGKQLSANPALVAINGYDTEQELLDAIDNIATEWYVDPGRREEFSKKLHENGQITDFVSEIYRHKTRERIWISENARLVRHPRTDQPLYYEGTVRDITDEVAKNRADQLLQNLTEKLPHGLFKLVRHTDRSFSCPYVSKRFREMINLPDDVEFDARVFADRVHPEDLKAYEQALKLSYATGVDWQCEFRFKWPNGEYHWCSIQASPEKLENGETVWHGYLSNVDSRKAAEEKVHKLAYYDQLTGLPNRTHFVDFAKKQLAKATKAGSYCAIGFIDVDNFKLLNDSHGHSFGDKLLQEVADRLRSTQPHNGFASRFGGDEFVIMFTDLGSDYDEAKAVLERSSKFLLTKIFGDFTIDNIDCSVTMSLGFSLCDPSLELRIGDLLKSADVAMYEVKRSGRNNAVILDRDLLQKVASKHKLQRDIQAALDCDQFAIELQPKFDASGVMMGAETLVRWYHPEHGRIMPSDFIELAEQTGQVNKINDWVLQRSIEMMAKWQSLPGLRDICVSVNISPRQMLDVRFIAWLKETISQHKLPTHCLILELTEHAMARDPDTVEKHMRELQEIGVRFSLDDFGTGYSSMARLRQLPFDELKIDGSFVADIGDHKASLELVSAILSMAGALGLKTVAEHVTSMEQFKLLSELGCDLYQGYLFSRPLPVSDFEEIAMKLKVPSISSTNFKKSA